MEPLTAIIKSPKIRHKILIHLLILSMLSSSCKKYIEVDTPSQLTSPENVFKNDQLAASVLNGIYTQISNSQLLYGSSLISTSFIPELSADNLTLHDPEGSPFYSDYYRNSLEPRYINSYGLTSTYWYTLYSLMYTINTAIEGLKDNSVLTVAVRNRLLGEAYFMRGFCYFYLVNFYGGVPLVLSTKYNQTANLPRNSVDDVYNQINTDLALAEGLLDNTYVGVDIISSTSDRVRPNLAAVNALQARAFLYQKNYKGAEDAATKVINQSIYGLTDLDETFIANGPETIWSLQPVQIGFNTFEAATFILPDYGPEATSYPAYASSSLVNSFEAGDQRKNAWIGNVSVGNVTYYYPAKYKIPASSDPVVVSENTIVLRLAEQYLIRAEARNEQNNPGGAAQDLNAIRNRSRSSITAEITDPLPAISLSLTTEQLRPVILHERRVELFTEWGHRWFDLKRSGTIDAVMASATEIKGDTWSNYKSLYPIPADELSKNRSLVQNPGYIN